MSRSEDFTAGFAALFDGFGASEVNYYAYEYVLPGRPMLEQLSKALSERLLKEVTQNG